LDWTHKKYLGDSLMVFARVFWSFRPYIEGFKYCRSLINVDKAHLYGQYDEKLLIAVVFNANNEIFLLAFAIVDEENNDNRRWFLLYLQIYVSSGRIDICIISDRHADIKNKVEEIWCQPLGYHQYCARHFVISFNHKFQVPIVLGLDTNFFF